MRHAARAFAAIAIAATLAGCGSDKPKEFTASDAQVNGQRVCRDAVRNGLKSPKTADFDNEVAKAEPAPGGFDVIVTGEVSSQNSFGAMVTASYTCKAKATLAGDVTANVTDFQQR